MHLPCRRWRISAGDCRSLQQMKVLLQSLPEPFEKAASTAAASSRGGGGIAQ
jgi:hypothetical protein